MKLLIDENLPKRLKLDFPDYEIFTVNDMGWNGKKNGQLLKIMIKEGFDVLLTFDKNLQYQQNFIKYPITESTPKTLRIKKASFGDIFIFLN